MLEELAHTTTPHGTHSMRLRVERELSHVLVPNQLLTHFHASISDSLSSVDDACDGGSLSSDLASEAPNTCMFSARSITKDGSRRKSGIGSLPLSQVSTRTPTPDLMGESLDNDADTTSRVICTLHQLKREHSGR